MKSKYIFFVILMVLSCDDIIEQDISKQSVRLRAPSNGYDGNQGDLTFWWDEVDGASKYRLTVASPLIDSAEILVLDTVITKTQFTASIPSGKLQWCVMAMNGYYTTKYFCNLMTLDSIAIDEKDISDKKIVLQSPSDKLKTDEEDQILWWEKLDGAIKYHLIVASPDVSNVIKLVADTIITNNTFNVTLPVGKSQWCVKGKNGTYETTYTCRTIEITE